jgi:hypothetical protein
VYERESHYFFADSSAKVISDDSFARLLTFYNVFITLVPVLLSLISFFHPHRPQWTPGLLNQRSAGKYSRDNHPEFARPGIHRHQQVYRAGSEVMHCLDTLNHFLAA